MVFVHRRKGKACGHLVGIHRWVTLVRFIRHVHDGRHGQVVILMRRSRQVVACVDYDAAVRPLTGTSCGGRGLVAFMLLHLPLLALLLFLLLAVRGVRRVLKLWWLN